MNAHQPLPTPLKVLAHALAFALPLLCIIPLLIIRTGAAPTSGTALPPTFEATDCRFAPHPQLDIDCGDLIVPESTARPAGAQIRIHTAIVHSRSPQPLADPVLYLQGGPGSPTLQRLTGIVKRLDAVLATRDLILIDQRGSGYSQPLLACGEIDALSHYLVRHDPDDEDEFKERMAVYRACRERLAAEGIDIAAYSLDALASDVVALRRALGIGDWNLYAVSYGTRVAQLVVQQDRPGVRSVVLDSTCPLELDLVAETAVVKAAALEQVFIQCAADPACRSDHPDLPGEFYQLIDTLDARPATLRLPYPGVHGWYYTHTFDGSDLIRLVAELAQTPGNQCFIPALIARLAEGDNGPLENLLRAGSAQQAANAPLYLSVTCQDTDASAGPAQNDLLASLPARVASQLQEDTACKWDLCTAWLAYPPNAPAHAPVSSNVPTLIFAGQQDTVTLPQWSEEMGAHLVNGRTLIFPDAGHGVLFSATEAGTIAADFYTKPGALLERLPATVVIGAVAPGDSNNGPRITPGH